jgi:predicted 3-demethylubiquinone-9 3-methyltransferase (glyoxalase superfamily)
MKNQIIPCLWFNGNAKEAATFYSTIFKDTKWTEENPFVSSFESAGQKFMCLNGGPQFQMNPSISFYVQCDTADEVNQAWEGLIQGGSVLMPLDKYDWSALYGWVQDRYGVSWQLSLGKPEDTGQKYVPFLMFTGEQNGRAEQAIQFYTSVFQHSGVTGILRYGPGENENENAVKHAQFSLGKNVFMVMESSLSHDFGFNEAVSFVVDCDTQQEIDYYWEKLSAVPEAEQCGWLKDQFGVSWQIVPSILPELLNDPAKSEAVTAAFMQMKKFDIEALKRA